LVHPTRQIDLMVWIDAPATTPRRIGVRRIGAARLVLNSCTEIADDAGSSFDSRFVFKNRQHRSLYKD
jgi:hypothetical protein